MNTVTTPRIDLTQDARCRERIGKRAFISYRRADGHLTKRMVKVINVKNEKMTVWCEKRNGLRQFKLRGIEEIVPLALNEFY